MARLVLPAVVLNLCVLFSIDRLDLYPDDPIHLGREGPLEILPELTIIPDDEEIETFLKIHRTSSLEATEIDWIDDRSPSADDLRKRQESPNDAEFIMTHEENPPVPEVHPMHKSVPRSETYKIIYMVEPEYPPEALERHEEGEVVLQVYVNEAGRVEYASVVNSEGGPEFESAALEAIYQFLFEAPVIEGKARSFWHQFVIRFHETSGGTSSVESGASGDGGSP